MTLREFLERVASKLGADVNEVEQVFQKFLDVTTTALRDGEKVNLASFGTFSPKITKATKKFSAILNREIEIPEKFRISFSPASKLADEINLKYKEEKPQVLQPAAEREIEKKVTIMPPEKEEEISKADKLIEEISKFETESTSEQTEEEVSLSAELLEALKEAEEKIKIAETEKTEQLTEKKQPETQETKEVKEEVSQMPEMNLNQEKPKFTYGEDLTSAPIGSGYRPTSPTAATTDSPAFKEKESSSALWVTLIILLIGIIGIGIYWALSTDVTEKKKEPVVAIQKETTPPVVIEKQPMVTGKKQIIVAPEEYASIPPDTTLKEKQPLLVEEPKKETTIKQKQTTPVEITKVEQKSLKPTIEQKQKPITRRRVSTTKTTVVSKSTGVSSQGDYFIQVNSYTEKRFADAFAKDLRNKGYRAFVESADVAGYGKVYRVKVGFYLDEDAASKDYHALRLLLKKEDIYVDRR